MPNSGIDQFPSFLQPNVNGPEWITGGSFGIENSYIPDIPHLIIGVILIIMAYNNKQIVKPLWTTKQNI